MDAAFNLGPHAGFILAAYAFTGLVIVLLIAHAVLDHRTQRRTLAALTRRRDGDSA